MKTFVSSIKNLTKFERTLWIISIVAVAASYLLAGQGDYLTLASSVVGVSALIFMAKGDVTGQYITVAFCILYALVSFQFRYYGEMITFLCMALPIAIASIVTWLRNPYAEKEVKVQVLKKRGFLWIGICTVLVTIALFFVLRATNTTNLTISTISVATSFLAACFLMLRSPYYAVAYGCNDIVLIIMWIMASMEDISYAPMIVCFVMFLFNDMYGFYNWRRMQRRQKENG
ncbi:MAG: nicotinamide mononucleotide transporter [Eubacterium sp.]|nr:nicotinamide mononucleotide transporter [Eubacterium sp.]